jgi:transposase
VLEQSRRHPKALVPDPAGFKSGRRLAAWLGLTPKSHSNGGKERLGKISKMGNPELRSLLVLGAHARGNKNAPQWLTAILARRPYKVVAVALANKMARTIWALLTKGGTYRNMEAATGVVKPGGPFHICERFWTLPKVLDAD